jgi:eukaryotic-like serine/threonine-protein kinase
MQDDAENSAGVRPGDVLAGKYRIERVLGVGGMGVVVAAHHVQLDEKVAIKFLLPAMLRNQEVVGRFAREARAAVKIKSEHVARVSDVGTLENGAPYMVMEFLEGGDLAAWLQERGPLPIEQAVDFVVQACVAVADAHGIGIVHRDLKPANLFCARRSDGQLIIKVLDFGISKLTELGGAKPGMAATKTAAVMGSPLYMSPEQMQSAKDVDATTDIWALGIILYELLTGNPPFLGESFAEIAIKVATASFVPVRSYRPDVPVGLEAVIIKCLEKDKRRRYTNVAELALALADFSSRQSRHSIERIVGIIQASGLSTRALALPPSPVVAKTPVPPGTKVSKGEGTAMQPEPSGYAPTGTMAPSANTAPGLPGARRKRTAVAAIVGAGVLLIAAGVGWRMRPKSVPSAASELPLATAPAITPPSASSATPVVLQPPKAADLPVAPASATSGVEAGPKAIPGAGSRSHATHGATQASPASPAVPQTAVVTAVAVIPPPLPPSAAPHAKAKPDCDPNYFFDDQGQKHFKPECFQ